MTIETKFNIGQKVRSPSGVASIEEIDISVDERRELVITYTLHHSRADNDGTQFGGSAYESELEAISK